MHFRNVLDIGTGTGAWATAFAETHTEAAVIGVDLSPIHPEWMPSNCKFLLDDAEAEWDWPQHFSLIQCRMLDGCFKHPTDIFTKAFGYVTRPISDCSTGVAH